MAPAENSKNDRRGVRDDHAKSPVIVWHRDDLRIADNAALSRAIDSGRAVLALFILDEQSEGIRASGGARRWWLHHSLTAHAGKLRDLGIQLVLRHGRAAAVLDEVIGETGAGAVLWNRRYHPAGMAVDRAIKADLAARGIDAQSFAGHLLHEPDKVKTGKGDAYKVYTPFWRAIDAMGDPPDPLPVPPKAAARVKSIRSDDPADWTLLPTRPDWSGGLKEEWTPGEDGAAERLDAFIADGFASYGEGRDLPGPDTTSRLSPHLAFGEITPYQIWHATHRRPREVATKDRVTFRKEIVWREFAYHLLTHWPQLPDENFNEKFDAFPWRDDPAAFAAWTKGETGYPMVDAGMRQLWRTGWMHNRVRMTCASFLTKHLLIDWRKGEEWFWDTLVDADAASNASNWQWVAGSGADAAPYFRIFNPVLQAEKFDAEGAYVRRFVPELAELETRHIFKPWQAPKAALERAGVTIGVDYPEPIVAHDMARNRALDAYNKIKDAA